MTSTDRGTGCSRIELEETSVKGLMSLEVDLGSRSTSRDIRPLTEVSSSSIREHLVPLSVEVIR